MARVKPADRPATDFGGCSRYGLVAVVQTVGCGKGTSVWFECLKFLLQRGISMVLLVKIILSSMLISGGVMIYAQAQHLLAQALYLGDPDSFNSTREDCVWKRGNGQDVCPDEDISIYLYTSGIVKDKFKVSKQILR
uniref:Lipase domain-containing protein n=1 Tax=Anopheles maculatus TaxID=74869 RepID=A0A182TC75_9DIPT